MADYIEKIWVTVLLTGIGLLLVLITSGDKSASIFDAAISSIFSGVVTEAVTETEAVNLADPLVVLRGLVLNQEADKLELLINDFSFDEINSVYLGMTPVMLAASLGKSEVINLLLRHGADPNVRGSDNRTALQYAAEQNRIASAKLLLAGGADINGTDDTNLSPLIMAVDRDFDELAFYLINAGADPDIQHIAGHTALIDAARNGDLEMVKSLKAAGASSHTALPDGRIAKDIAQQLQHFEIAVYLSSLESGVE